MEGYDVAICQACGAAFSSPIPDQAAFDTYYATMSKYTSGQNDGAIGATDAARFRQIVDIVSPHVGTGESIADIGCATGGLLAEFKRRGYAKLTGFDPSPECAASARRLYDIEVKVATLRQLPVSDDKFDLITLTGVLEHLPHLDMTLDILTRMLNPGGQVYIEVPDATSYDKWYGAPFQYFSMEHINFFSPASLANLFGRHGFVSSHLQQVERYLSSRAVEPAISGLFRHVGKVSPVVPDGSTEPALMRYIESSRKMEERIHRTIDALVEAQTPLAVWGAGTHTLRLLKTSSLSRARLVAFLDSNASYQGKELVGVKILNPGAFENRNVTILISSQVAEREIRQQIENVLRWPNPIVCLYENEALHLT